MGSGRAAVQSLDLRTGFDVWQACADGGANGSAFALPASPSLSRSVCVGEWLDQSPRVVDADAFSLGAASPFSRAFLAADSPRDGGYALGSSSFDAWDF